MEKESVKQIHKSSNSNCRERVGGDGSLLLRASSDKLRTSTDFVLQWGNGKRLRCQKIQVKTIQPSRFTGSGRVLRIDKDTANKRTSTTHNNNNSACNGFINLRQRPPSPQQRVLRNLETSSAMRGQSNGGMRGVASQDRGAHDKKGTSIGNYHHNENNKSAASSETAHDSRKGGSSSGSGEAAVAGPPVWPPKFVIALTNKERGGFHCL